MATRQKNKRATVWKAIVLRIRTLNTVFRNPCRSRDRARSLYTTDRYWENYLRTDLIEKKRKISMENVNLYYGWTNYSFLKIGFCPVTFCLQGILSCDILCARHFALWHFVYLTFYPQGILSMWHFICKAFCPVTFCLEGILSCDILSERHFVPWPSVFGAFFPVAFCPWHFVWWHFILGHFDRTPFLLLWWVNIIWKTNRKVCFLLKWGVYHHHTNG